MGNKFYDSGADRAAKVQELFRRIARRYDLINDLQSFWLHRYWKEQVARQAAVKPGALALDLCCGTGDVTFALCRAGARVVGLDFTAPMLAQALRKKHAMLAEKPRVEAYAVGGEFKGRAEKARVQIQGSRFLCGDALRTPFADSTFDVVSISYGLRNLSDFEGGLKEMLRVAKPGGRLLILDFGKPDNALWRWFYFLYLKTVVPLFGRLLCGDSETHGYILESLTHYPAQNGVAAMMKNLGCRNVGVVNFLGGVASLNVGEKAGEVSNVEFRVSNETTGKRI